MSDIKSDTALDRIVAAVSRAVTAVAVTALIFQKYLQQQDVALSQTRSAVARFLPFWNQPHAPLASFDEEHC